VYDVQASWHQSGWQLYLREVLSMDRKRTKPDSSGAVLEPGVASPVVENLKKEPGEHPE
jgi:hypothetical protein